MWKTVKYPFLIGVAAAIGLYVMENRNAISGHADVIDGDTITVSKRRIRIFAIDAPEISQTCQQAGRKVNCGINARDRLREIIGTNPVTCRSRGIDKYRRTIAVCYAGDGRDIGREMVASGHAIAYVHYSREYEGVQQTAKASSNGLWAMAFEEPYVYRKNHRH